jgi:subtilase family serine protease
MRRFTAPLLAFAAALSIFSTTSHAQSVQTHHVRDAIRNGQAQQNGRLPASQTMNLDLVLPLRDPAGLDTFLADIYNPASPNFHHFLTPAEFTAQFGPTQADYDAVVNFANANGLTVTGGTRDGMDVQVRGRVSSIESALHVTLKT